MPDKQVLINLRTDEQFKKRLDIAAEVLDRPYSQIMREATNEKLDRLAKQNRRLKDALDAA